MNFNFSRSLSFLAFSSLLTLCATWSLPQKRDLLIPSDLPSGWSYLSCYTDNVGGRTLSAATYNGNAMTGQSCISFCANKGYQYAGTEYSGECYCGSQLASSAAVAPQGDCNMACTGDGTQACGGANRLSVFHTGQTLNGPGTNPGPPGWTSLGCYTDSIAERTLVNGVPTPGGGSAMTIALCTSACRQAGYTLAGAEYAGECYCGNSFSNGGGPAPDGSAGCNMPCGGNISEFCGGSNRLNVYSAGSGPTSSASATPSTSTIPTSTPSVPAGWISLGCYTDGVGTRTLPFTQYLTVAMTWEACTAACAAGNYPYAGVEYSGECYCGTTVIAPGGPAPDGNAGCNMPCNGNPAEICGGPNRLTLFSSDSNPPVSSTPSSSTQTTTTPSSSATLSDGWTYRGCYIDGLNGRILNNQQPDNPELTVESCVSTCFGLGYSIAAAEYGVQCFCDNFIRNGATSTADSDCSMPCAGDTSEYCGAGNRMSVYSNSTLQVYYPPVSQKTGLPGSWTYQGCLYDDAILRTFPYQIEFAENNTAANCLNLCAEYGYGAGGMEYGEQCFCGDQAHVTFAGSQFMPESDCNMPCTGNASQICGSGNRISFYNWTGTPLESWDFASGPAAGRYEFLIGGPLIPLITTVGLNNKIVYLEKFGTSPANNSTGAYELDLSALENYDVAWRPMHVKSDIFCAAGLVLPDKVGRQISVGGWANDATYGIRLYTPDGSDGVWGVNDWEENVQELSLMAGRWYPTAMIMANGSILVIGGQVGSNGAPVPSLEVLPRPAGATESLYCDYLERTDPYNLYPYLAVLPSGGIFVAYYNEARILEEGSLETDRVLPNIPGAVNTFLAGRSYPMEGTAMLLPQHAPYTDPLGILICGGSTIGPEIALDNCVSIEPELSNANWTIERMPSKRVITCMVALPDGTFLIVNGAQQGFAGFGLATEPNHNAVLYDPTKPAHNRMTVMANTTIDRLYHSEAILLPDGRVLVSGSDPEDERFVQEYRNEVFIPPYLLNGIPQPTFTIVNDNMDWDYSETITLQVSTTTSDIKVSLMGAVSSTHGNSMGQRTIFPEVSCGSGFCTVTAPPNAHVCPPGWFMLYVLDNGTPSHSQWVRIGGDPAELGNWPDLPDFIPPGV